MQTENLTILLTDIVGFSKKLNTLSRVDSQRLLKKHDRLLKKHIKSFGGDIIKSIGDSFLVSFRSPTDATLCAMVLQDAVWEYNKTESAESRFELRIAISLGEVRVAHNDVYGDAVNIAARLESITPAGQIYLTESVYLTMNKSEVSLSLVGAQSFKGISQPICFYQVDQYPLVQLEETDSANQLQAPFGGAHINSRPVSSRLFHSGKIYIAIVAAFIAALLTWWITFTTMIQPSAVELDKLAVEYNQKIANENVGNNNTFTPIGTDVIGNVFAEEERKQQQLKDIYLNLYQLLSEDNYLQMNILLEESLTQFTEDGKLYAFKAHAHIYFKEYEQAAAIYEKALKIDSTLADEKLFAKDLVALLDIKREKANQLIAYYLSPVMIEFLSQRTGEKGLRGRYDAFYLLRDSGNQGSIDRVGLNIWDLRETNKCSQKKTAVLELKRLADPRSLEVLKESVNAGFLQTFKYGCFLEDAREAITLIESKGTSN